MQRREGNILFDGRQHFGGEESRLMKIFPAMDNTMADRIDIVPSGDDPLVGIGEYFNGHAHAAFMIGNDGRFFNCQFIGGTRPEGTFYQSFGFAYSFDKPRCQNRFVQHIEELKFYRRTPRVDYKYFHFLFTILFCPAFCPG
jgi:hypothetical protein